jgi:hypothetical protein
VLRDKLRPALNNGRKRWNDDEPAVVQAAGEIISGKYLGAGYDVRAVTDFVAELRKTTNNDGQFPRLNTEAVIRAALGETDADQLIGDAERIAFDRGWHPPLAG